MNDQELNDLFRTLFDDILEKDEYRMKRPILAHYTSLEVLENVLKSKELWFSNPLFMNDFEEVNFGITNGLQVIRSNTEIKDAIGASNRYDIFIAHLDKYSKIFYEKHFFNTHVFCLSEHDQSTDDGLLSMWRGYGSDGNGVAVTFSSTKFYKVDSSPLIISQVIYATNTERLTYIEGIVKKAALIIEKNDIPDDKVFIAAYQLFERLKVFSLFTKHAGFSEEKEWRVAYMPDRDGGNKLTHMLSYFNGPSGVQPKLKFKLEPIEGLTAPEFSLTQIVDKIILGPTSSSVLAKLSVRRMIENLGEPELAKRIVGSSIPFRQM